MVLGVETMVVPGNERVRQRGEYKVFEAGVVWVLA
jgi:hypothetical protein